MNGDIRHDQVRQSLRRLWMQSLRACALANPSARGLVQRPASSLPSIANVKPENAVTTTHVISITGKSPKRNGVTKRNENRNNAYRVDQIGPHGLSQRSYKVAAGPGSVPTRVT